MGKKTVTPQDLSNLNDEIDARLLKIDGIAEAVAGCGVTTSQGADVSNAVWAIQDLAQEVRGLLDKYHDIMLKAGVAK